MESERVASMPVNIYTRYVPPGIKYTTAYTVKKRLRTWTYEMAHRVSFQPASHQQLRTSPRSPHNPSARAYVAWFRVGSLWSKNWSDFKLAGFWIGTWLRHGGSNKESRLLNLKSGGATPGYKTHPNDPYFFIPTTITIHYHTAYLCVYLFCYNCRKS